MISSDTLSQRKFYECKRLCLISWILSIFLFFACSGHRSSCFITNKMAFTNYFFSPAAKVSIPYKIDGMVKEASLCPDDVHLLQNITHLPDRILEKMTFVSFIFSLLTLKIPIYSQHRKQMTEKKSN